MRWCALEIGRDCADVTVMPRDFRSVPEADISLRRGIGRKGLLLYLS
jgi:hypothetical protein